MMHQHLSTLEDTVYFTVADLWRAGLLFGGIALFCPYLLSISTAKAVSAVSLLLSIGSLSAPVPAVLAFPHYI